MTKVKSKNKTATDANTVLGAVPYEYGAMSSKFRLYAANKLTAYATMVLHYNQSNHLVVIFEPESSKEDMWTSLTGKVSERLDKIFGGEGPFDKYLEEHISEIKECYKSIERLV